MELITLLKKLLIETLNTYGLSILIQTSELLELEQALIAEITLHELVEH